MPQLDGREVSMAPRTIVLWLTGLHNRHQHDNITPVVVTPERAKIIEEQAKDFAIHGPWCDQIDKVLTPQEKAFYMAVWDAIPSGSSTFMSAFYAVKNGEVK